MDDLYLVGRVPMTELVPASPLTPALSPEYRGEGEIRVAGGRQCGKSVQLPPRFQRVRARGWKMPPGGRCCSRPGRWGNPIVGEWAARYFAFWARKALGPTVGGEWKIADLLEQAILRQQPVALVQPSRWKLRTTAAEFFAGVEELRGRPLGCFCSLDEPCHVDTLLVLANELDLRRAGHDPAELLRWQMGRVGR